VLLGGLGQVLIQIPPFFSREFREARGFRATPGFDFANPGLKRVGRGAPNIVADAAIARAGDFVDMWIVSPIAVGALSSIYYGRVLFQLPFALVSQTINTVVLKEFSEGLATRDKDWTRRLLIAGINWNVFLLLPISVFSVLFARPLVDALFVGRNFTSENARDLATALQCYSLGLVGWGVVALTGRFFAARAETGTATLINLGALCVNVASSLLLVRTSFGFAGVALATTFSFTLAAAVRLAALNRRLREEDAAITAADVWPSFARTLLATGAGAVAASLALAAVSGFNALEAVHPRANAVFGLLAPAFFGVAAFGGAAFLLQSEELDQILARFGRGRERDREEPATAAKPRPVVPQWLAPAALLAWVERNPAKAAKTELEKRVAMLLDQPRWQDRNIGVKLVGLLKLRNFRGRLCALALDRRPAKLSHRAMGGDFREPGFVRRNALLSLAKLHDPDEMIEDALLKALDDPYFEARAAAANAAATLANALTSEGRRRLAERVARMTEETNFETATAATQALGRLAEDDGAVEVLRRLHDHANWRLRDAAVESYLDLYKRGVLTDRERLSGLLDDVLATCDDFRPRFPLKERLLEARKMCRPAAARDAAGAA
jgi:hypothetical protein